MLATLALFVRGAAKKNGRGKRRGFHFGGVGGQSPPYITGRSRAARHTKGKNTTTRGRAANILRARTREARHFIGERSEPFFRAEREIVSLILICFCCPFKILTTLLAYFVVKMCVAGFGQEFEKNENSHF